jgi:hypothetical protein
MSDFLDRATLRIRLDELATDTSKFPDYWNGVIRAAAIVCAMAAPTCGECRHAMGCSSRILTDKGELLVSACSRWKARR